MNDLRFTLLSDGSSDEILLPILDWLLRRHGVSCPIQSVWADLRRLRRPPQELSEKIDLAVDLYPCELLFVHRDAERQPLEVRKEEISRALSEISDFALPAVCVIPVRMQEAWILFDERSIRNAAGNPHGRHELALPRLRDLESLSDPKQVLHDLLRDASGLHGRRRKNFPVQTGARRVVEFIEDFSPLLELGAFVALDHDVREAVHTNGWAAPDQP